MVEVEEHERKGPAVTLRTSDLALDALLERAMVEEAGQRIARRLSQETCARVGVRDRQPHEVGEDAETFFHVGRNVFLVTGDDEQ